MSTNDQPKAPWPPSTETWHTYQLHCHCGTIRYKITISPPLFPEHDPQNTGTYDAVDCHCSYCVRNGILPIHPLAKNVEWEEKGLEWRKEYFTASKQHPHWFCGKCGSSLGTDLSGLPKEFVPDPRVGVNLRMLKDFDPSKIRVSNTHGMDMKEMGPKYPPFDI